MDRIDTFNKAHTIQSNDLIRSAYSMTLIEKKLLIKAMSKIDTFNPVGKDGCVVVELTVKECQDMFGANNIWRELSKAASLLQSRTVTLFPTKDIREDVSWVDSSRYYAKESKIRIKFGHTISKKLTGIIDNFTQVELLDVARLKSVHSVRLFELLKQVETSNGRGWLKISVDEFRIVMGIEGKYKAFSTLNIRVIEAAMTELNKSTNWTITLERIKKGKAVHMLNFSFYQPPKAQPLKEVANKDKALVNKKLSKKESRENITAAIMNIHDTSW